MQTQENVFYCLIVLLVFSQTVDKLKIELVKRNISIIAIEGFEGVGDVSLQMDKLKVKYRQICRKWSKNKAIGCHFWWASKVYYPANRVGSIFPRWVGKEEATLLTSSSSFDLPIIQRFGWVRQVSYWINQFYPCTHAHSGVLLTLSAPTLHKKIDWAFSFGKTGKCTQTWNGFCFELNHVLSRFYFRERIPNPVSVTRSSWKDKLMGFE